MIEKVIEKIEKIKKDEIEGKVKEAKLKILFELLGEYYYEERNANAILSEVDDLVIEDDTRLPPIT